MTTTTTRPAIAVSGLRKSYGDHVVLDGIDLHVPAGTIFALLGPNGAGKTTTVQILTTLIGANGGDVHVAGHDLAREPDAVRAAIGVTGQFSAVDDFLTGEENLLLMARPAPPRPARRASAGPPSCSNGSTWSRRRASRPRPTPAACVGGSTSR